MHRFSLIGLFLFITCVACGFVAWNNSVELRKAQAEISHLRAKLGVLNVTDRTKLHVVSVSGVPPVYRWQVFVPENEGYQFAIVVDGIELAADTGANLLVSEMKPGEQMVTATIGFDSKWAIWFAMNDGTSSKCAPLETWGDVAKNDRVVCRHIAGSQTHTIDPQPTEQSDGDLLLSEWSVERDAEPPAVSSTKLGEHSVQLWIKKITAKK